MSRRSVMGQHDENARGGGAIPVLLEAIEVMVQVGYGRKQEAVMIGDGVADHGGKVRQYGDGRPGWERGKLVVVGLARLDDHVAQPVGGHLLESAADDAAEAFVAGGRAQNQAGLVGSAT